MPRQNANCILSLDRWNGLADLFGQNVGSLDIVFANAEFCSRSSKPPVNPSQRLITGLSRLTTQRVSNVTP
jgi:hypothetical protein